MIDAKTSDFYENNNW